MLGPLLLNTGRYFRIPPLVEVCHEALIKEMVQTCEAGESSGNIVWDKNKVVPCYDKLTMQLTYQLIDYGCPLIINLRPKE